MRIAHLQHPFLPGHGYQENCLPPEQARLGHEVRMFTSDRLRSRYSEDQESFSPGVFESDGVTVERLPSWFRVPGTTDVVLRGLKRRLDEFDPDVIHSHGSMSPHTYFAARYCEDSETRLYVDDHIDDDNIDLDSLSTQALLSIYRRTVLPKIAAQTDLFLPIHRFSQAFLVNEFGIPQERTRLLPLGVDTTIFSPDRSAREAGREELDIADSTTLLITAGNLVAEKRVEDIITVLGRLRRSDYDVELVIVGRGSTEYMELLREHAEKNDVRHATKFVGFVERPELSRLYNAADIGIWPGIGISINEAIGTGLPVVIGKNSSTEHLAKHDNGFTFERGDVSKMNKKVKRYLSDSNLLAEHSENAAGYARSNLSWEAIAEQTIEVYSDCR